MKTKLTLLLLLVSSVAFGGLENARVVHHAALTQAMNAAHDEWVAYQVPSSGRYLMCCIDWISHGKVTHAKTCRLGQGGSSFTGTTDSGQLAQIDRSTMIVALRADHVEVYSGGCPVDAGGATVHVADNVSADESLRVLEARVGHNDRHRGALVAIAMHGSPLAAQILERFATTGSDHDLRGDAIFWFAQAGGRRGFEVARQMTNDPDHAIRKKAVFALTQSKEPEVFDALAAIVRHHADADTRSEAIFWFGQHAGQKALPILRERLEQESDRRVREKAIFAIGQVPGEESTQLLIKVARTHPDTHVRKQALFWLGQKAEAKIASTLRDFAENDPQSEVREAAVFAISQRPHDEAIPQLIHLAQTNRDPRVRKKAVFWLSQIDDPRAVAAIEKMLLK